MLLNVFKKPSMQIFAQETACAALWMFTGLILQAVVNVGGVGNLVPSAVLFSVPFIMSKSWSMTHIIFPVRIMEWEMGRFSFKRLRLYLIAHGLGYCFGLVLFSLFIDCLSAIPSFKSLGLNVEGALDIFSTSTAIPTSTVCDRQGIFCTKQESQGLYSIPGLMVDMVAACLYGLAMIVLPEILAVNKKAVTVIVPFTLLLIVLAYSGTSIFLIEFRQSSMLNPICHGVLKYGKWLNSATISDIQTFRESILVTIAGTEPFVDLGQENLLFVALVLGIVKYVLSPAIVDLFAGCIMGSLIAGTLCNSWFPDDPATWKPWRKV